ncbi:MAG: SUMF1/EgtB/PvdO family nonheme iron enzyme [Caldilineaceae bacterium]
MTSATRRCKLGKRLAKLLSAACMISVAAVLLYWLPGIGACTNDAQFMVDISQPEKSQNIPGNIITKVWRVRNSGTCPWTTGYKLAKVGGDLPITNKVQALPAPLEPQRSIDLSVSFTVPKAAGEYTGEWRLQSPSGAYYGPKLTVNIVVVEPELDGALPQLLTLGGMGGGGGGPCEGHPAPAGGTPSLSVYVTHTANRVVCFDNFPDADSYKIWVEDPVGNVYFDESALYTLNSEAEIYLQSPAPRGEWRVTVSGGGAINSTTFQVSNADFKKPTSEVKSVEIISDTPLQDPLYFHAGETITLLGIGFPANQVLPVGIYNDDQTLRYATTAHTDADGQIMLKLPVLSNWLIGDFRDESSQAFTYELYVLSEMATAYHGYAATFLASDYASTRFVVLQGAPRVELTAPPIPNRGGPVGPSGSGTPVVGSNANWVAIPAGEFTMGSDEANLQQTLDECNSTEGNCERDWFASETPQRDESTGAYSIMRQEVTNGEYSRCVEAAGCTAARKSFRNNADAESAGYFGPEYPVTGVTGQDAANYCSWAGGRLPTEFEWEKAARGTDGRRYPWGNSWQAGAANLHTFQLFPIGSFPNGRSPFGIDDMAGNVVEWTATIDQRGRAILRGGGFESNYFRGRATDRGTKLAPDFANFDIGFRCVR